MTVSGACIFVWAFQPISSESGPKNCPTLQFQKRDLSLVLFFPAKATCHVPKAPRPITTRHVNDKTAFDCSPRIPWFLLHTTSPAHACIRPRKSNLPVTRSPAFPPIRLISGSNPASIRLEFPIKPCTRYCHRHSISHSLTRASVLTESPLSS
ncbi:hypothetical protein SAY87_001760 [Trapa incisa]|uniref:Uncharacterized protein n=1 Tax=Trapa incisa TaxID=236973 RepID=A0AAN7JTV8_9MYRT|nr:hypothetical protein SAY87_001760 [Trapa incisa]